MSRGSILPSRTKQLSSLRVPAPGCHLRLVHDRREVAAADSRLIRIVNVPPLQSRRRQCPLARFLAGLWASVLSRKSLEISSKELRKPAKKARERTLSADEMKGGTFTDFESGRNRGGHFTPIVTNRRWPSWGWTRSDESCMFAMVKSSHGSCAHRPFVRSSGD